MTMNGSVTSLAAHTGIEVEYRDNSQLGGATSLKLQQNLRSLFRPLHKTLQRTGPDYLVRNGDKLLRKLFSTDGMQSIRKSSGQIRESVLHPDPRTIFPESVVFSSPEGVTRLAVDRRALPAVHDAIAELSRGVRRVTNGTAKLTERLSGLTDIRESSERIAPRADLVYIGHNTLAIRGKSSQVVVDPWFFPTSSRYPAGYQPITRRELAEVDCVAITHSHPDHFHPGSLLQFHRDTHIVVPKVPRESILSLQMAERLRELGFQRITELDWWSTVTVGDLSISATPFYGEQPTVEDQLHPEVRNHGNSYVIRGPRSSYAIVADCGRDRDGTTARVALEAYRRWGPVDAVFSGFRGWNLYPIQYFESSVRQYLLFVPPDLYGVRQSIMSNVDEAIDTAEAWHARYLVPYADGGAPWFSDIGLGPKFGTDGVEQDGEWEGFDALPERCIEAARRRATPIPGVVAGSSVSTLLLRPGGALSFAKRQPVVVECDAHRWPWGDTSI